MSIGACLERLDEAIQAASALGVDSSEAAAVAATARERLGFPGESYVLALAGGTGVGKSSLLNALAGDVVSRAGVRRPTTSEPVAWVPARSRSELAPVLQWLGVTSVVEHTGTGNGTGAAPAPVAVLDLPDLDSISAENRARVDELLPRIDAVAWVADPEKYQDALLHDEYLRRWAPRLAHQIVVLNKADRVTRDDAQRLRADLGRRLRQEGLPELPVVLASAADGAGGVADFREWLDSAVEAKRVVRERLAAEARAEVDRLAVRAGLDPSAGPTPLISSERRVKLLADVTAEVLRVVDLTGLERQAIAATRLAARPRGGGPMGGVTAFMYRWSGRQQAAADPAAYLARWRTRGSLVRAAEPLRRLVADTLPAVPAAARAGLAAVAEPGSVETRLSAAVDRAVASRAGTFTAPRSAVWWVIGLGQYAVTALLLFAALWFVTLYIAPATSVATVELPVVGPVPQPAVFLAAVLVVGYLLARALGAHAGWLGRRWAQALKAEVSREVERQLEGEVLRPLDALEGARARLARAARATREGCSPGALVP